MIERLVGVYDADGGIVGEVRYVVGHLLGRTECALCDITHSPVRRKRDWVRLVDELPVPVVAVHRNELPRELADVVVPDRLPAVYAVRGDGCAVEFVTRDELAGLDGSVERFGDLVRSRLRG
ncbi:MAG: hypothetical protein ABR500_11430 [Dermatophilaceae bacterium]|nr:hypothetical protein [Intrasporangiaceae bacterium]